MPDRNLKYIIALLVAVFVAGLFLLPKITDAGLRRMNLTVIGLDVCYLAYLLFSNRRKNNPGK